MLKNFLYVALGGALGSVLRYGVSRLVASSFPWGTLTVNLLGCLLIGLLTGLVLKGTLSAEMKLLLVTGLCGGFTTFSTFANESFQMLKVGDALMAAVYVGVSVFVGVLAVFVGQLLTK